MDPIDTEKGHSMGQVDVEESSRLVESSSPKNIQSGHVPSSSHQLTTLPLIFIMFYAVSGGPYGVEQTVLSAGAFYTLIGFIFVPFLWALPEAAVAAELTSAFPVAAGTVAWVEMAFGRTAGWVCGYLSWISGATIAAIYPILFLDYLMQALPVEDAEDLSTSTRFLFLTALILAMAFICWRGLVVVGNVSIVICLVAMSPFVLFVLLGLPQVKPSRWFRLPAPVDTSLLTGTTNGLLGNPTWGGISWSSYLNNIYWNLNAWMGVSTLAGDIRDPQHTIPRAFFWSFWTMYLGYVVPLLVALGVADAPQKDWVNGYLATVVADVVGTWLGTWVVFGAALSNAANFEAALSEMSFQLMGMSERRMLPRPFSVASRYDTPTYAVLLGTVVILIMSQGNYTELLEMMNFVYSLEILLAYSAFIKLRIDRPDLHRPFRVPLETFGCMLLLAPAVFLILIVLALASYVTILFGFGAIILGVGLSFIFVRDLDEDDSVDHVEAKKQHGVEGHDQEISSSLLGKETPP